jgi:thiol-disulfide isomerase/thioredoxin
MRRTCFYLLPAFALIGFALTGCARDEPAKGQVEVTEVRAPAFEKFIKEQKGKVVLVDCWATWCAPCVKKFPQLVERHKKYAEKGLVCVSVCMEKVSKPKEYDKEKVLEFLKEKKATFPNFIVADPDKDEEAFLKLLGDFSLIPYMALFDRNGRRIWASDELPRLTDEQLDKKIEALLADKP